MILAFDLDDTLYEEITFVKSGLKSVSDYLYRKYLIPKKDSKNFFYQELLKDRNKILDKALIKFNIYSKNEVKKCLSVYRSHNPKIQLYPQVNYIFRKFGKESIYIITDGNKLVQKNKNVQSQFSLTIEQETRSQLHAGLGITQTIKVR